MDKELLGILGLLLIGVSISLGISGFIGFFFYAVDIDLKMEDPDASQYLKEVPVITQTEIAIFYLILAVMFFIGIFLVFRGFACSKTNNELLQKQK